MTMTGAYLSLFAFIAAYASHIPTNVLSLSSTTSRCLIRICHNKDCTKHGGGEQLLNVFRDLLPGASDDPPRVTIESSGCLSQCGKGPNVAVIGSDKKEQFFFGVVDPTTASAVLDVATGVEFPIQLLVAATSIVEAEHTASIDKKEAILSSVIAELSNEDSSLINSFARAHALFLRADARLDMSPADIAGAVDDATLASQLAPSERKVWRVLSSAHEANGNIMEAINAVRKWGVVDPSLQQKRRKK